MPRCWEAAIAQQCIGLLSSTDDFFPEALGFNMAYESLPYHLLVSAQELKELRLNNYYFAIHVTIDNADSGHSAMARLAVERYLEGVKERDGEEEMERVWKRVQAGYILAEGLPTTPSGPMEFESSTRHDGTKIWRPRTVSPPATKAESKLVDVVVRKSTAASKMHCTSKMSIGGRTVEQWLDPTTLTREKGLAFIRALAEKRPYVIPGEPPRSRLVKDLEWGGRMFGAFSRMETEVVRAWVTSLRPRLAIDGAYDRHVGAPRRAQDGLVAAKADSCDVNIDGPTLSLDDVMSDTVVSSRSKPFNINCLMPVWFTSISLLERFPLSPSRFASPLGMTVLRLVRSQLGFGDLHLEEDICAGTDDIGLESAQEIKGLWELGEEVSQRSASLARFMRECENPAIVEFCNTLLALHNRPYANSALLLGISLAFARGLHGSEAVQQSMHGSDATILARIAEEEETAIMQYVSSRRCEADSDKWKMDFCRGYEWTKSNLDLLYI